MMEMNEQHFFIPVKPMGAVRMTQRSKWMPAGQRYLAYKGELQHWMGRMHPVCLSGPIEANVTFWMPLPLSWSMKKRLLTVGMPHTSKPDLDNLVKGFFDAANTILWKDDKLVYRCLSDKFYGETVGISFAIRGL